MKKFLHDWNFGNILGNFWGNLFHSKDSFAQTSQHSPFLILPFLALAFFLIFTLFILRLFFRIKKSVEEDSILLEITPPALSEKSAYATQQLFSTIHGLGWEKTKLDKLLGKKSRFSFEIVSTRSQGIRYLVRITPGLMNQFKRNLLTHLPYVTIKTVNEYLPDNLERLDGFYSKVVDYKLTKPFAHPLHKQDVLQESDPVGYITGQMTKLSPGELISLQIILSPTKIKETESIERKIRNNDKVLEYLHETQFPFVLKLIFGILKIAGNIIKGILTEIIKVFQEAQLSSDPKSLERFRAYDMEYKQRLNAPKPPRMLSPYEQEIIESIKEKIGQPLFNVAIRLLVIAKDKKELKERISGFSSSLRTFAVPGYQELRLKRSIFDLI